jgi:hypothetical protein
VTFVPPHLYLFLPLVYFLSPHLYLPPSPSCTSFHHLYLPHPWLAVQDPAHPNNLAHTITNVLSGRMRPFPEHMSMGCRHLISGLLRTNPGQRTTLTVS